MPPTTSTAQATLAIVIAAILDHPLMYVMRVERSDDGYKIQAGTEGPARCRTVNPIIIKNDRCRLSSGTDLDLANPSSRELTIQIYRSMHQYLGTEIFDTILPAINGRHLKIDTSWNATIKTFDTTNKFANPPRRYIGIDFTWENRSDAATDVICVTTDDTVDQLVVWDRRAAPYAQQVATIDPADPDWLDKLITAISQRLP